MQLTKRVQNLGHGEWLQICWDPIYVRILNWRTIHAVVIEVQNQIAGVEQMKFENSTLCKIYYEVLKPTNLSPLTTRPFFFLGGPLLVSVKQLGCLNHTNQNDLDKSVPKNLPKKIP